MVFARTQSQQRHATDEDIRIYLLEKLMTVYTLQAKCELTFKQTVLHHNCLNLLQDNKCPKLCQPIL